MSLRDLIVTIDFDGIDIKQLLKVDSAMDEIEGNFMSMDGEIKDATKDINKFGSSGSDAMDEVADGADSATDAIEETNKTIDDGKKGFDLLKGAAIAAGAAAAAAFGAFVVVAKQGIDDAIRFDNSMREVFTLLPGISEQSMDEMKEHVKGFSKEWGVLPDEVVPALYQSLSAGVPKDNVFDFMAVAHKAAVGGVSDLTTAVDGITSVVNAYGAEVIDATKASDIMFTAVKLGKTDFGQLSSSLFNVLPNAAAAGVAFEDVAAGVAALTAQGTPTSVATTRMRAAIDELNKSGTGVDKTFRELAGKSFKEFIGEGNNLQDAFQMLEQHAQKSGLQIADLFGSVEAGGAATALTGQGTEAFTNALKEMGDAAGATDAAFETMDGGVQASIDKWQANLAVMRLELGEKLLPVVNDVMDRLIEKLPEIENFIKDVVGRAEEFADTVQDNWPLIRETVIGVGVAVGAFVAISQGMKIYSALNALMLAYRSGTVVATLAQWGLNTAMSANPITWVIVGIAALIAIGVLLYRNWDTVKDKAGQLWDKTKEVFGNIYNWGAEKIQPVVDFFTGLRDRFNEFKSTISNFKPPEWVNKIGGAISSGISKVSNFINGSHATGLSNVPFDGYVGELHKGEAVLTAQQANALRAAGMLSDNGSGKPVLDMGQNIQPSNERGGGDTYFEPSIHITIEGGNGNDDTVAEKAARAAREELERFWRQMVLKQA